MTSVSVGKVYRRKPPMRGVVLVQGIWRTTDGAPLGVMPGWVRADWLRDGVLSHIYCSPDDLAEQDSSFRVEEDWDGDGDCWYFFDDIHTRPGIVHCTGAIDVLPWYGHGQSTVKLDLHPEKFLRVAHNVDEETWSVGGCGDIWAMWFSVRNTLYASLSSVLIKQQLTLKTLSGAKYPALDGEAALKVAEHLEWPKGHDRFEYSSPPLLPHMETRGILSFLLPPKTERCEPWGSFQAQNHWSVSVS